MLVAETTEITEALAQVSAGLDRLLRADIEGLDGVGIGTVFDWLEVERRRLDAVDVRVISTIEERRRDGEFAAATVVDMLVNRQHVDAADAQRRANRAFELRTRHTLIGEELPPLLPRAAIALADGAISAKHVDVVAKYVDKADQLSDVVPESAEIAEQLLVEASRHESPKAVARLGEALLARLDPDGSAPRDVDLDRERGYSLVKKPDGSSLPRGCLTPEATAAWEALFDALAAPATDADGSLDRARRRSAVTTPCWTPICAAPASA